jgi:hypothetical protein
MAGFLVAGATSVSLLAANAGWIFDSRLQGLRDLRRSERCQIE